MRLPVDRGLPLAALILLAGCGGSGSRAELAPAPPTKGPGADYPVVLGPPFTIDGVTYTPVDRLNYDEVGYAVASGEGEGVTLAHRTLPLPSYIEVTSLDTGRTILVRAERRGPMSGDALVELSPGAAAQLGMNPARQSPVRVRRVNPPEIERAALRRGEQAPPRMDTPKSLLGVLLRRLDRPSALPSAAPDEPAELGSSAMIPSSSSQKTTDQAAPASRQAPTGSHLVQVGAFAVKANAEATAARVGGRIEKSGILWLVRMGPYEARSDLSEALAKARDAGYSDARIQRVD
jgi:rare lipoprotein A